MTPPQKPTPTYSIGGRIRLEGKLTDETATVVGTRNIDDATGVMVDLLGPNGRIDSTRTADGGYLFRNLEPGIYRVRTWVVPSIAESSAAIQLVDHNLTVPDTLLLAQHGEVVAYPNPGPPEGIGIEFTVHTAQTYTVEVRSLAGDLIWTYSLAVLPNYYHVHWDGDDLDEHTTPAGSYWVIVHLDDQILYSLVFWPSDTTPDNPGNCGHIDAYGFFLDQDGSTIVSNWHEVQEGTIRLHDGEWTPPIGMQFLREDSTSFAIADSCQENRLTWEVADTSMVGVDFEPGARWTFRILGKREGSTEIILHGWHLDHIHFSSLPVPIAVAPPLGTRR